MYTFGYRRRAPGLPKYPAVDPLIVFIFEVCLGHQAASSSGFIQFTGKPETGVSTFLQYFRPLTSLQRYTVRSTEPRRYKPYAIAHLCTLILFPHRLNPSFTAGTFHFSPYIYIDMQNACAHALNINILFYINLLYIYLPSSFCGCENNYISFLWQSYLTTDSITAQACCLRESGSTFRQPVVPLSVCHSVFKPKPLCDVFIFVNRGFKKKHYRSCFSKSVVAICRRTPLVSIILNKWGAQLK